VQLLGAGGGVASEEVGILFAFGAFWGSGGFLVHNQLFNFVQIFISVLLRFCHSMVEGYVVILFIGDGRLVDHEGRYEFFFQLCFGAGNDTGLDRAVVERGVYVIIGYLH
jgi:hypothetical protein